MDKFIKFITNEKFYLPIIYVIIGLVLYFILKKVIDKIAATIILQAFLDRRGNGKKYIDS